MKSISKIYHRKRRLFAIAAVFAFLGMALILFFLYMSYYSREKEKEADLQRIASEEYQGIFLSTYGVDSFSEGDFSTYRGLQIVKCSYEAKSLSDISEYLDAVFLTENKVTNIYLGLDSLTLWNACGKDISGWDSALEEYLLPYFSSHPQVRFEILFSAPSLEHWGNASQEELSQWTATCRSLVGTFDAYANVSAYFPGSQHWLIANPGNYADDCALTFAAAKKLMLFTFCDGAFLITPDNSDVFFDELSVLIDAYQEAPKTYTDLSEWSVVFFGDSVMGNYEGSISVPGVTAGLSGAKVYNCATGGSTASASSAEIINFPKSVELFLAGDTSLLPEGSSFQTALASYLQEESSGQKLCFVINYGLNDYFLGCEIDNAADPYDESTYCGALRSGIRTLKDAHPEASILVAAPNFITIFSAGEEKNSEKGGVLTDYVDAAQRAANEMDAYSLNTYEALGYDASNAADYLEDGCHLNEEGRFLFGEHIIRSIEDIISPAPQF